MTAFRYRVATLADVDEIVRIVNAAYRPSEDSPGWTSDAHLVKGERANPAMINDLLTKPASVMLLAVDDDGILGCVHVELFGTQAYIGTLAVDPARQTKGIGRALGIHAEEYATLQMGATHFVTLVLSPRQDLIDFTLQNGYQRTGRVFEYPANQGYGQPLGEKLTMLEMRRRSIYLPKRQLKILFSAHPAREEPLQMAFSKTPHAISFDAMTPENIRAADLVVPLTIADLKAVNANRHLLANNPIVIPSLAVVELCDDKLLLNQALIAKGFGKYVPRMDESIPYPFVVKKRIDEWGANCHVIRNAEDAASIRHLLQDTAYFRQIMVPGNVQYAAHILLEAGKIVCSVAVKYTYSNNLPVQGRDTLEMSEVSDCPYLPLFTSMLNAIGFEGLCCIDYKVFDNRPFVLEINPRMGGSLSLYFHRFVEEVA